VFVSEVDCCIILRRPHLVDCHVFVSLVREMIVAVTEAGHRAGEGQSKSACFSRRVMLSLET
jgi:hypothetical protein